MNIEDNRLRFLEERGGVPEAFAFAIQAMNQYQKALETPYGKAYRHGLTESIFAFRRYIRSHKA